jgi:CheY-like chemotaxis protein/anti-sigma regulatory factor (Ser/Thr protein kinase)
MAGRSLSVKSSLHAEGAVVKLEDMRLRQALLNLVGNAADATREHGSSICVSTHVELPDEGLARQHGVAPGREFVVIAISDDGKGMDERTLARIFDPFFTTKQGGRGTGLGLAITQTVVTHAGGFVTVESTPSAGTTFRLYLPTADGAPPSVAVATPTDTARSGQKRILVVDDFAPIREFAAARLRAAGYDVVTASGTRTAAEALSAEKFDALLTDVSLLDGSGAVLARSARAVRPELPIVLMAGSEEVADEFDGTLPKPFDERTLLDVVTRAMAAHGVPSSR